MTYLPSGTPDGELAGREEGFVDLVSGVEGYHVVLVHGVGNGVVVNGRWLSAVQFGVEFRELVPGWDGRVPVVFVSCRAEVLSVGAEYFQRFAAAARAIAIAADSLVVQQRGRIVAVVPEFPPDMSELPGIGRRRRRRGGNTSPTTETSSSLPSRNSTTCSALPRRIDAPPRNQRRTSMSGPIPAVPGCPPVRVGGSSGLGLGGRRLRRSGRGCGRSGVWSMRSGGMGLRRLMCPRTGDCFYHTLFNRLNDRLPEELRAVDAAKPTPAEIQRLRDGLADRVAAAFADYNATAAEFAGRGEKVPEPVSVVRSFELAWGPVDEVDEATRLAAQQRHVEIIRTMGDYLARVRDDVWPTGSFAVGAAAELFGLSLTVLGEDSPAHLGPEGVKPVGYVFYTGEHYMAVAPPAGEPVRRAKELLPPLDAEQPVSVVGGGVAGVGGGVRGGGGGSVGSAGWVGAGGSEACWGRVGGHAGAPGRRGVAGAGAAAG